MLDVKEPLRVVMVDDDPDDIFITKSLLKRSSVPINFKGFKSGESLFEFIKHNGIGSIDVFLIDINMPVSNGYDVLKKLRAYQSIDDITLAMFSTSKSPHEQLMASELGADDFFIKPANIDDANPLFEMFHECYGKAQPVLEAAE